MNKFSYPNIEEVLYSKTLDNGLEVYIIPKSDYNKSFAIFTTKYGSIDSTFGLNSLKKVPNGIAHFLEHKLFENEDGSDAINDFTKYGGSANAFTSHTQTSYLFSSVNNKYENLEILLNFVQKLTITNESVQREKSIIEQEIKMYEDDSNWILYLGIIENMYKSNPVRIDIAGSVESVESTTKEDLEYCYNTFYHPSNMILVISGDIIPQEAIKFIEHNQTNKSFGPIREILREGFYEDNSVLHKERTKYLPISTPKVAIGIKEDFNNRFSNIIKQQFCLDILLYLILGDSSENYERLSNRQIIDESFSFETTFESSYGFAIISCDTKMVDQFVTEIKDILFNLSDDAINEQDFIIEKNKIIGDYISSLNSVESIAKSFTAMKLNNVDFFDTINVLESIKLSDIKELFSFFNEESFSIMKILPEKKHS